MPELPEVETTRRGLEPRIVGRQITAIIVRRRDLRQAVPLTIERFKGHRIDGIARRGKYLLLESAGAGSLLMHLGMSGSLRLLPADAPWKTHDHVGITLDSGQQLRYHDPRRFGLILRVTGDPMAHPLLAQLGPEPLGEDFTGKSLKLACTKRRAPIKQVLMDAKVVVGVGNIYASEALFRAGIRPDSSAVGISGPRLDRLVTAIRAVLNDAIAAGGTTLRDFSDSHGNAGAFSQQLAVYGRQGKPCRVCGNPIEHAVLGQRSTYWCPKCQRN